MSSPAALFRKVPAAKLGVSEPDPSWFGNPANESKNPNWTNGNWLKSRFHFSFAEYTNPRNLQFGVLRVMNDDLVQPNRGFGRHPHRDMEICTYVVQGDLTHQDSMGSKETLSRGSVQYMSAGRGVQHSEHNLHPTNPLRFIQIWIQPRQKGLTPRYGGYPGREQERLNRWAHLVGDISNPSSSSAGVQIHQDANLYVTEVEQGQEVSFSLEANRQAYLVCLEGEVEVSGAHGKEVLSMYDAAEVFGGNELKVKRVSGCAKTHVLMLEMAYSGKGRSDL
eukprot:gene9187-10146_t